MSKFKKIANIGATADGTVRPTAKHNNVLNSFYIITSSLKDELRTF